MTGDKIEVRNQNGEQVFLSPSDIVASLDDEAELQQSPDDLVMLDKIDEPSILQALRVRFMTDRIYTNIGDILISVNPFKMLPLYTPQIMETFRSAGTVSEMPPHVYSIAAAAYDGLIDSDTHDSQSVLIR